MLGSFRGAKPPQHNQFYGTALLIEHTVFFRFWDVRNMIFGNFGGRGPLLETRAPILRILRILVILGILFPESAVQFGGQNARSDPLLGVTI